MRIRCTAVCCSVFILPAHSALALLFVLGAECSKPTGHTQVPLFTKGVYPIVFAQADFPVHPKTLQPMRNSKDCAPCHETAYRNWNLSRHRVALTNELYHESHTREPSPWCVNCHAPLRLEGREKAPYNGDEGVSCLVCHARRGEILAGAPPAVARGKNPAHVYRITPELRDERFCENCHDFNFPTAATAMSEGAHFRYTDQPMQSTVSEYRASSYYGKITCNDCHVFSGSSQSHSFPGGHAIDRLAKDLRVEIQRIDGAHIGVKIFAQGIGHAFPTGDLFRTLRLQLSDATKNRREQIELRHVFAVVPKAQATPDSPIKLRVREETLPPPQLDYTSMREYIVEWPVDSLQVFSELYIDYLSEINTVTTRLPLRLTRPLIKRERFQLKRMPATDAKG